MADHLLIEHGLAQVIAALEAENRPKARALWSEFEARTRAHLDAEDQHLVPLLIRWRKRNARAIVEEHKLIRRRLNELGSAFLGDDVKVRDIRRFGDEFQAHARTEELYVYQWADGHLTTTAHDTLLREMARAIYGRSPTSR